MTRLLLIAGVACLATLQLEGSGTLGRAVASDEARTVWGAQGSCLSEPDTGFTACCGLPCRWSGGGIGLGPNAAPNTSNPSLSSTTGYCACGGTFASYGSCSGYGN